ncbi:MAG TPA: DUF5118 domain-containing protein, partial [Chitinophagaceae bacterium]|nr:DUF5118 domain-containing protein [Chitinophagaceae bacterium]
MQLKIQSFSLTILCLFISVVMLAQPGGARPDTTRRPLTPAAPSKGPKPYKEVISSKAVTDDGLFKVHKVEDKYYFEIPESLFGREILV